MDSLIYFGQFVRLHRRKNGLTQRELSLRVFTKPNVEYIGRLERGLLEGITFATADKILMALDCEMQFEELPIYVPDLHRRYF